ncbi:MAG: hypothetical protein Kow00109_22250 [Acidobacteriota bacterium]
MNEPIFPTLNAVLNLTAFCLLWFGRRRILAGDRPGHRRRMLGAVIASGLFLAGYLTYHYLYGSRPYPGTGWCRGVYLAILLTHTVLAAAVVPLVGITLWHAWRGRYTKHRRWARPTWGIWVYVSLTGIAVYLLLYRLPTC